MSKLFETCQQCKNKAATVNCPECSLKLCYNCDNSVHATLKGHSQQIFTQQSQKQIQSLKSPLIVKQPSQKTESLQQELARVTQQEEEHTKLFEQQEQKLQQLVATLDQQYKAKINEFRLLLEQSQNEMGAIKERRGDGETSEEDLQAARQHLASTKELLQHKEEQLKLMAAKEEKYEQEINKKEEVLNKFKEILEHQEKEKKLIANENEKVLAQLMQIRELFKEKLPQLGIDPNMLEQAEEDEEDEEDQVEVQHDPSTEDDS